MKRVLWILIWILTATVLCSAQTIFYFPQVADGGGWKTTIFITNPAAANANLSNVTITFTKSNGTAFNVAFVDAAGSPAGSGNTLSFQIAGGQSRKFVSTGASASVETGFATVSGTAAVAGTAVFSQFSGTRLLSEAGVPSSQALVRQAVFVDTLGGFSTGVAMANPNSGSANLVLSLLNSEGVQVMSTTQTLLANNHVARFTGELFAGSQPLAGSLQIVSSLAIPAIALRFSPDFSAFTTLPPVSIASLLKPAVGWLEERPWLAPLKSLAKLLSTLQLGMG